jgi:hypothetical protein
MPVGADSEMPFAHRLERNHLLDVVRVKVLELLSVFKPLDLHGRYPQQGRRWGSP